MGQYNLISCCLQNVQPICNWLLEKSNEIKDDHFTVKSCKKLLAHRGDYVLEKRYGTIRDEFRRSISDAEFDHSLLLWHIATGLCYYTENNKREPNCGISKYLSDYMLYLLVFCPSMLPEGIAEIRYRDTLAECMRFFSEVRTKIDKIMNRGTLAKCMRLFRKRSIDESKACKMLLLVRFGLEEEQIKGDRSQSVLFYGCGLAKQLQNLEIKNGWNRERKWEMISEVWVEMLVYATNKCTWKEHGQQLQKGGELLTHVRILMAHLGLSEQYRIQKPYFTQQQDIRHQKFNGVTIYKVIATYKAIFAKLTDHFSCRSCCTNRQSRRGIRA
ncbi:hypothetical protein EZV62_007245 [Acer yangbiense]|uniref:DUF4220 domain-containing protein n=1 Tax=Acer yangbiense TaxID=1000413 RepID=A0A5C7I9K4_9ROSI|nr:hypothetical protein EZV62_007245 [Acer yangbiense]